MKTRRVFIFLLGVPIIALAVFSLLFFVFRNYIDSRKLIRYIQKEDLLSVEEIIDRNPACINTHPTILKNGWKYGMHPITEACSTGNIELVKLLIRKNADVNVNDGLNPLAVVYSKKVENWYGISCILIENGAELEYSTVWFGGGTAIFTDIVQARPGSASQDYVAESWEEVWNSFLFALENCNLSNVNWMRVLQHSVSNDRIEIVKLLLEDGYCSVNDTSVGMTALMFAARDSTPEMVRLLLDYGADKSIVSFDGETAFDYAMQSNNKDIIALLED